MKVAVSALGPGLDDRVDERFGRAAYLLVVDVDTMACEAVDNSANLNAMQGAGLGAAEVVSDAGCSAVNTGHLGPKAFRALSAIDVEGYSGAGMSVREAVDAFAENSLDRLAESESHKGLQ